MRRVLVLLLLLFSGIGALIYSGVLDDVVDGLLSEFASPARIEGPVLPIAVDGGDQVLVLTRQTLSYSFGRRSTTTRTKTFFDLAAYDGATARALWTARLRTVTGGREAGGFLIGRDGDVVWLYLAGIQGVSTSDGRVVADAARLEQENPDLKGQVLAEARYYAFARGLIVTAADGRVWRIGPDLKASPAAGPPPQSAQARAAGLPDLSTLPTLSAPTAIPAPGIALPPELEVLVARPGDAAAVASGAPADPGEVPAFFTPSSQSMFRTREVQAGRIWVAVMDDPPAAEDARLVTFARPPGHRFLGGFGGEPRRQRLWIAGMAPQSAAPPGWPADFPQTWGENFVLTSPRILGAGEDFLGAGLFGDKDEPFVLTGPDGAPAGVLLAHRSRLGDEGRVLLSRVALDGRVLWTTDTTLSLVQSVMPRHAGGEPAGAMTRLILLGRQYRPDPRDTVGDPYHAAAEILASIDLETGTLATHVFPLGDRPWR